MKYRKVLVNVVKSIQQKLFTHAYKHSNLTILKNLYYKYIDVHA